MTETLEYGRRVQAAAEYVESRRMPVQSFYTTLAMLLHYEGTDPLSSELGQRFGRAGMDVDGIRRAGGHATV